MQIAKNKSEKTSSFANTEAVSSYYQERFLSKFLWVITGLILLQTGWLYYTGDVSSLWFSGAILVGLGFSFFLLKVKHYNLASSLAILIVLCVLLYFILANGLSNATIFWFFAFPVLTSFLKGKRDGVIWLLFLVLIIVSVFLATQLNLLTTIAINYDALTFRQLIASVVMVALFVYFYQDTLDKKDSQLGRREKKLAETYKKLEKEVTKHKATAHRLAESLKTLEEKQAKEEALLNSIGECVIAINKDEEIISVNPTARLTFNLQGEDLSESSWYELFPLVDGQDKLVPKEKRPLYRTLITGRKQDVYGYYILDYNKEKIPVAITATPVMLDDQIDGAIEIFRDISYEKAIEKTKDEFVSLASHQLRTPLASIKWYTESLLNKKPNPERLKSYLKSIYKVSSNMTTLLNDFLNVSRLELGAQALSVGVINIPEIIKSSLKELNPTIEDKEIEIKTNYLPKAAEIVTDKKLLDLIVENLLSNAVKYNVPKGKITISLAEYSDDKRPRKDHIILSIEDTGMGIPPQEHKKIFTKLFRANNVMVTDIEGTGLGLYATRSAVGSLNGLIWFDSKPGKGTTFAVVLPKKFKPKAKE